MRIVDAASRQATDLTAETEIRMYVCGPTVYNHVHLGNVRPLVTFDVLHRFLKDAGKRVEFVHNVTDIDDKIVRQAAAEGVSELELSDRYARAYAEIMGRLGVLPTENPKVSEAIGDIVAYVRKLVAAGAAYELNGSVYFDVGKSASYGCVARMRRDELQAGEESAEPGKKHPADFALWKKTDAGIAWESPWGAGRPGWHTECACLVAKRFGGRTLTLHGGGIDLRFPHHENENAQHAALHGGAPIAQTWMHVGHVNIGSEKMSKSLNNFVYARDLLDEHGPAAVRWAFYQTHYRSPLAFSRPAMDAAAKETGRLALGYAKARSALILAGAQDDVAAVRDEAFAAALADDLNFANATQAVWALHKAANDAMKKKDWPALADARGRLRWCLGVYGLVFPDPHTPENVALLKEWDACVRARDYARADALRQKLIAAGMW